MVLRIWRVASIVVLSALLLGGFGVAAMTRLGGMGSYVVISESMAPTLQRGDLVLVAPAAAPDAYRPGDVITFREPARGLLTHRVVRTTEDGSAYVTRGDANQVDDVSPVPFGAVEGRVRVVVPGGGLPMLWASDGGEGALKLALLAGVVILSAIGAASGPAGERTGRPRRRGGPACIAAPGAAPS
jgi:signal peptidase